MFSFDRVGERFRANAEHVVTIIDKVAGVFDCRLTGEGVARSEIVAQRQVRQIAGRKGQGWVMRSWRRRRCMRLERVEAEAEANVLIFDFASTRPPARRRHPEAVGAKIVADAECFFGPTPNIVRSGPYTFFAGSRSDAFFFDFADAAIG